MDRQTDSQNAARPFPLRILLVEDSELVRDLLIDSVADMPGLVIAGYCDTEEEALLRLCTAAFDILILDINLKHGNGLNVLRRLSSTPATVPNPIIIFSNNGTDAYRRAGMQYGARHFFDKSSDFPQLCGLLEQLGAAAHQVH